MKNTNSNVTYYRLRLNHFQKDLDNLAKKLCFKRFSKGQFIEIGVMADAIMEALSETGEYETIGYEHIKIINRVTQREYRHGMKKVDIDHADTELIVKCFDDDVNNDMLCQSLFDDTTLTNDDKKMLKYLYNGHKIKEIAVFLNVPKGTVTQRLYRLKKSLAYLISDNTTLDYSTEKINRVMDKYFDGLTIQQIAVGESMPLSDIRQIIKQQTTVRGNVMPKYIPSFA